MPPPATPTHVVQVPAPSRGPVRLDALVHRQLDDLLHGEALGRAVGAKHLQRGVLGGAGLGALLVLQSEAIARKMSFQVAAAVGTLAKQGWDADPGRVRPGAEG